MPQTLRERLERWWGQQDLPGTPGPPVDCLMAVRDACFAIRRGCVDDAERILQSAAELGLHDAAWLNVMGVVHESRGDWCRARRFYGKAMRADRRFAPAEQNMRRWYELVTFGRTTWPIAFGDNRAAE